ncbi:hypothetical protein WH47_11212 [Habropoda laboriosa]|uniref:Uncharacterized protein n=1 Tax=Habropoda laboriosa TaxID=597456 RepID=A0A0L7QKT5_9HYME|nr:PREDICTED: uncharacterized protein LOC108577984 [Habropoda laboriosa]KOC59136.1 hypothetical protein WH47_11212 [Habropoda laboriosa]
MGSTRQQDRLLGGGISLPQWMKGKSDNRFDFDDTTFSPPSHDDSFFYIRYPKGQNQLSVSQEFRSIDDAFSEENVAASSTNNIKAQQEGKQQVTEEKKKKSEEIDFSKHPLPCQPFVPTASKEKKIAKGATRAKGAGPLTESSKVAKSQGIDDGFHGEPALCGKSIVLVASQMMSNRFHESFSAEQTAAGGGEPKKGSKSLPATPLTSPTGSPSSSPKARRRVTPSNRYFTGSHLVDREKYQGGWILASIFGQSREIVTAKIDEEDETGTEISAVPPSRALNRKKSISSQNLTYVGSDEKSVDKPAIYSNVFQAKPSELREMNFWSPTSM